MGTQRHQPYTPAAGKFLYLIVFTVQVGNQADSPDTVGSTTLHQRIGAYKRLS